MSDSSEPLNRDGAADRFLAAAVCLVPLAISGYLTARLLFPGSELSVPLRLLFAAVLIVSVDRWTGMILLLFLQADLFLSEPRRTGSLHSTGEYFRVFWALILLAAVCRLRSIRDLSGESWLSLRGISGRRSRAVAPGDPQRRERLLSGLISATVPWLMTACRASLSVGLAAILLAAIPPPRDPRSWQQLLPERGWQVWPGPLLLVAVTAAAVVACELGWRQLSPSQAQMYLRSVILKLHFADLRIVVRRQLRLKKLLQQRRVPRSPEAQPAGPSPPTAESLPWEML